MSSDGISSSDCSERSIKILKKEEKNDQPPKVNVCLDISQRSLSDIPLYDVANLNHLQFLYLQGNSIEKLPKDFFYRFPALRHLDLRQNRLIDLSASIAGHNSLEVLLLQDNLLTTLPCELGQVPRLRKLQFSGNPLIWPSLKILSRGLGSILSYLRKTYMEHLSAGDTEPIPKANDYDCTKDEDSTMCLAQGPILNIPSPTKAAAKDENSHSFSSQRSHRQDISKKKAQMQTKNMNSTAVISLKGSSQLLKTRENARNAKGHTQNKSNIKRPSLQPHESRGHAQAIMKGQTYPLGYKKRIGLSTTKIYTTLLQQLWLNQLKYTLQSQDAVLQKQKTADALKQWRQDAKELQKNNFEHNWSGLTFPYDMDSNCLKMISRMDWQTFQNMSLEKRGHSKPSSISCARAMGLQEKIKQILRSYEEMKSSDLSNSQSSFSTTDPSSRCKLLAEEMKRISNLQKAVQALRLSTE